MEDSYLTFMRNFLLGGDNFGGFRGDKIQKGTIFNFTKKCDRLCFQHFEKSQLSTKPGKSNSQPRLKLGALPSLNLSLKTFNKGFSDIVHEENEEIMDRFLITDQTESKELKK